MMSSLSNSVKTFLSNIKLLTVFSITFLVAILLSILANTPTFNALGGVLLRFMSIPEMGIVDWIIIVAAFLISNYLISFGIVAVNLIVKKERTYLDLSTEIKRSIPTKTLVIFLVFTSLFLFNGFISYFLINLGAPTLLTSILFLIFYFPTFYIAPAMVIEDLKPVRALFSSLKHIERFPMKLVKWLVVGIILIYGTTFIFYLLVPSFYQWLTIIVNALFILPFLIIYQAHAYIDKYRILGG